MERFATKLFILAILSLIHLTTAKSNSQSASIISGQKAKLGQFPWHVIVVLEELEDTVDLCGGSIIADKWILTAAHCLSKVTTVLLIFGTVDLAIYHMNMNSSIFFIHPEYSPTTDHNDIALIKLPKPLKFNNNINKIDLLTAKDISQNFTGAQATICGYGRTEDAVPEITEFLLWTTVEIVNNIICDKAFHDRMPGTILCTVGWHGTNQSACHGDSGGALVWKNKKNQFVQIGIISYGEKDKCSQYPTVNTRVISYINYIKNIISQK